WGLGMRLDSVTKFPFQLTLGALSEGPFSGSDQRLVYEMGLAVGEQCKRLGVHVNYAPVVDINNNPNNPVIGYRSFGEDKNKVGSFGVAYMKGMQDAGIMACAKHFPGHGDTEVDSHYDLPLINKTRKQLDSLELMPFQQIFEAGVGSVMIAHLYIPSIDNRANRATSLSKNNVTDLLRISLGYQGLTFTDALEMKGVSKFFPSGEASVEALIAGNDMLCLPEDVGKAIDAIKKAIDENRLSWAEIDTKVKKVLSAKYQLGMSQMKPIDTSNLLADLNAKTDEIRKRVAKQSITVLKKSTNDKVQLPLKKEKKIAYVAIGSSTLNDFGNRMINDFAADTFLFSWKDGDKRSETIFEAITGKYDAVVIGIHDFNNRPANNYSISNASFAFWRKLNLSNSITFVFGNVLAAANYCNANALVACYQDDNITQQAAADLLQGKIGAMGKLPVRVCNFLPGYGLEIVPPKNQAAQTFREKKLLSIDSIINDAINQKAFPGCVVLAAKDGEIIYHKSFGTTTFDSHKPVKVDDIFDLASVTKISATTISVMKLYEQGKINLKKRLGDYLPWVKGTDKANLVIEDILLHQAGLVPFIPFYKETVDSPAGIPFPRIYSEKPRSGYSVRVAENLFMRNDWQDTMINRILKSPLSRTGRYVYSDNDFIFLAKIVEQVSGLTLDQYVRKNFYTPMGLKTIGFKPRERFDVNKIIPTEEETHFRRQLIQGDVHDEGASMFGGVAGHAGLFSDAYDLAMLYQMLLNGGEFNNEHYFDAETIKKFTTYGAKNSRRALGFDKPEKDNAIRREPYPSLLASPQTFGHTGFTGTCVWVDPEYNLVYVFLSNRVNPSRNNNKISQLLVRGKVQDVLYEAIR
ncbi:MAG TPA: glycoside hydrolase family 3 N-terminal domain-containing protein, partial [Chitinophagaceae bacterium]|nr:glycoside hydrolase family 3 N-terminal domain-containing protein [Chitinophagaceae bacterium]